jgi:SWI/SNF-related matrix-associated actin-dependent regulator of chromatin subfamily A containing DEAD/H box 1
LLKINISFAGCDRPQADVIISKRPFEDADDLITKLGQGRRKAGPKGLSPNLFDDVVTVISGYTTVDDILKKCEAFGENIRRILESWTPEITKGQDNEGGLALGDVSQVQAKGFIQDQPQSLAPSVVLKDYQVIGLNWLNLMFQKKRSCILADEMGKFCSFCSGKRADSAQVLGKRCRLFLSLLICAIKAPEGPI